MAKIDRRYDFVLLFDVKDGNPNGDPDAGNLPRIDPETGHGLVTDVCLKRKIRNYVQLTRQGAERFDIFVKEKAVLNESIAGAYAKLKIDLDKEPADPKDGKKRNDRGVAQGGERDRGKAAMCAAYWDIRAFGAVMSTGSNAGQVRGPLQLTFSRSVGPIVAMEHAITRVAITRTEDAEKKQTEMGRKMTIPYGLYLGYGFVNPLLAAQTGFDAEDLALLWEALPRMFDQDRSAARGLMALRKVVVFQHESELGNAPAHRLFELVRVTRKEPGVPARAFEDYDVKVGQPPSGVKIVEPVAT